MYYDSGQQTKSVLLCTSAGFSCRYIDTGRERQIYEYRRDEVFSAGLEEDVPVKFDPAND